MLSENYGISHLLPLLQGEMMLGSKKRADRASRAPNVLEFTDALNGAKRFTICYRRLSGNLAATSCCLSTSAVIAGVTILSKPQHKMYIANLDHGSTGLYACS